MVTGFDIPQLVSRRFPVLGLLEFLYFDIHSARMIIDSSPLVLLGFLPRDVSVPEYSPDFFGIFVLFLGIDDFENLIDFSPGSALGF